MLPMEIERKFTIKYLPQDIEKIIEIAQKHIYRDMACSIRGRKSVNLFTGEKIFTHTIKAKGDKKEKYSIIEIEKNITEDEYNKSKLLRGSRAIKKYRCVIPIQDGLKAEVDIFEGWMKGLIVAEVEFKSVEQAENFKLPTWFGNSIDHKEFSNRVLSTKSRYEIMKMIGRGQLETNKKILNYLQKGILRKKLNKR